jgi:hypothetical protein
MTRRHWRNPHSTIRSLRAGRKIGSTQEITDLIINNAS